MNWKSIVVPIIVLAGAAAGLLVSPAKSTGTVQAAANGKRYDIDTLYKKAMPVFKEMNTLTANLRYSHNLFEGYRKDGTVQPQLRISSVDAAGMEVGYTVWDMEHGRLILAGQQAQAPRFGDSVRIGRPQVVQLAKVWLKTLGLVDPAKNWKLEAEPELNDRQWRLKIASGSSRLRLYFDSRSGGLINAKFTMV